MPATAMGGPMAQVVQPQGMVMQQPMQNVPMAVGVMVPPESAAGSSSSMAMPVVNPLKGPAI